ncbi:MAG: sulfotransferase [Nitrospirales bacterium]|nr:MAG: sulfotransferase [Nitrospirales bacterium]
MIDSLSRERYRPVIILGAARSGTKIFRDVIATHPSLVAIPHDVNFVWKYGNYHMSHDQLTPDHVTPQSAAFIHEFFQKFHRGRSDVRVIEKTVSNTIRADFVRKVFPSCQFIHLIRDGRDVIASSVRQWQAPLDSWRVLHKVQYLPLRAIPNYAVNYAVSYLKRKLSSTNQVASWGVVLEDLGEILQQCSLLEVCAIQWRMSVEYAMTALQSVPETDKLEVRYEHFVQHPLDEIERILKFLGLKSFDEASQRVKEMVDPSQVGKWKHQLASQDLQLVTSHISRTMNQLGYFGSHEPTPAV